MITLLGEELRAFVGDMNKYAEADKHIYSGFALELHPTNWRRLLSLVEAWERRIDQLVDED